MKYQSDEIPCIVTGSIPTDLHHVLSRGAGGGDEEWNLMPLTHRLHQECHTIGLSTFADKYFQVKLWLIGKNWAKDFRGKWKSPKDISDV